MHPGKAVTRWRAKLAQVVSITAGLSDQLEAVACGRLGYRTVKSVATFRCICVKWKESFPSSQCLTLSWQLGWSRAVCYRVIRHWFLLWVRWIESNSSQCVTARYILCYLPSTSRSAILLTQSFRSYVYSPSSFTYCKFRLTWLWIVSSNGHLQRQQWTCGFHIRGRIIRLSAKNWLLLKGFFPLN